MRKLPARTVVFTISFIIVSLKVKNISVIIHRSVSTQFHSKLVSFFNFSWLRSVIVVAVTWDYRIMVFKTRRKCQAFKANGIPQPFWNSMRAWNERRKKLSLSLCWRSRMQIQSHILCSTWFETKDFKHFFCWFVMSYIYSHLPLANLSITHCWISCLGVVYTALNMLFLFTVASHLHRTRGFYVGNKADLASMCQPEKESCFSFLTHFQGSSPLCLKRCVTALRPTVRQHTCKYVLTVFPPPPVLVGWGCFPSAMNLNLLLSPHSSLESDCTGKCKDQCWNPQHQPHCRTCVQILLYCDVTHVNVADFSIYLWQYCEMGAIHVCFSPHPSVWCDI